MVTNMNPEVKLILSKIKNGTAEQTRLIIQNLPAHLKDNKKIFLSAIRKQGTSLRYASEKLKNDKDIVLESTAQNGLAFAHASESLRNNKEFAVKVISKSGIAINVTPNYLQNDKEIIEAFKKYYDSFKLEDFSENFQKFYAEKMQILHMINEDIWLNTHISSNNHSNKLLKF